MEFEKFIKKVSGKDRGDIFLFTISTCAYCMNTKRFLKDLGCRYKYVDVDLLPPKARQAAEREIERFNPEGSFPTIVFDGAKCVVGFDEARIRRMLK